MKTTLAPIRQVELRWAGDEVTRKPAKMWRVDSLAEATRVLCEIAGDIGYHGGDPDTAGLVATLVTYAVTYKTGQISEGMTRVRYQSKPDFAAIDCL